MFTWLLNLLSLTLRIVSTDRWYVSDNLTVLSLGQKSRFDPGFRI